MGVVLDEVTPFEWARLFLGEQPRLFYAEVALRVVVIFAATFLIFQLLGKRSRKQASTFDTLVTIALGSAIGDVMFYPSVPILYAILCVVIVIAINRSLNLLDGRVEWFHRWVDGTPTLLVEKGVVVDGGLKAERLVQAELFSLLRCNGIANLGEVKLCYLEPTGQLGLIKFSDSEKFDGDSRLP